MTFRVKQKEALRSWKGKDKVLNFDFLIRRWSPCLAPFQSSRRLIWDFRRASWILNQPFTQTNFFFSKISVLFHDLINRVKWRPGPSVDQREAPEDGPVWDSTWAATMAVSLRSNYCWILRVPSRRHRLRSLIHRTHPRRLTHPWGNPTGRW